MDTTQKLKIKKSASLTPNISIKARAQPLLLAIVMELGRFHVGLTRQLLKLRLRMFGSTTG
jgi:hypothetical protein